MKNHTNGTAKKINVMRRAMLLMAAIVTVIALTVMCAFCFDISKPLAVDGVEQGEASASLTNRGSLTGDQSAAGKLNNNDYLTYAKTGTVVSIKLPIGEFKLEVWGAQGGKGYNAYDNAGKGGYTTGTIKFTVPTTIYIVVGGVGSNATSASRQTVAGGYNGGGTAKSNRSCQHNGGGGGGATHMATATGTLNSLSGNKSSILIVAGGGGGGGNNSSSSYAGGGGGGARTGGTGALAGGNAGLYATGGNTGSGGTCSGSNPGASGSFGIGGNSTGKSNYSGGAGGGGGYYGGSGGANPSSCSSYGGGGGSSYAKSTLTSTVYQRGAKAGDGYAAITVINVNQDPVPVSGYKTYSGISRVSGSVAVKASEIATDPDQVKTALLFSNGLANRDTLTKTNSISEAANTTGTGLYLNSACTTNASKYLNWTWASDSQINITKVKLYPRNGVDGCTLNGRLTLYAKVRDSFGTAGTQRGYKVIMFYVKVSPNAGSKVSTTVSTAKGNYFVGTAPTSSTAPSDGAVSGVYNPNGARYTVTIEKPIQYNQPFTITAASVLSGISGYDQVVMALNSTTAITGTTRKFKIDEYDSPTSTTKPVVYNRSKVQVANTFTQLSFRCLMPDPAWQVFSVKLYVVEKNTAYTEKNVAADVDPIDLDIVFKMDNNRPTVRTDKAPLVNLNVMTSTSINLSDYYTDQDIPASSRITSATHTIKKVVVPTYEYIQLDKYEKVLPAVYSGKSVFNVLPFGTMTDAYFGTGENAASLTGQLYGDGTNNFKTGFSSNYITTTSSNSAFVQYSFSNDVLTLTGLRATYDLYKSNRTSTGKEITGKSSISARQIENLGHFYILINVQDKNDVNDSGIWLPLAIVVNNTAPTDTSKERGGAGASIMPTAEGIIGSEHYFTPMGITVDRTTYALGVYENSKGAFTSNKLYPLAADADNFYTNSMTFGGKLNELLQISSLNTSAIYNSVTDETNAKKYFSVEFIPIYVPTSYFGGRVVASKVGIDTTKTFNIDYDGNGSTACYQIRGIKVTLLNWTHNRYLYATVGIRDSATGTVNAKIAIFANNTKPERVDESSVVTCSDHNDGKNISSKFSVADDGTPTITYNMPVKSSIIITPYDLLWDNNIDATRPTDGFTLNGFNGMFGGGTFRINDGNGTGTKIQGIASNQPKYTYSYDTLNNDFSGYTKSIITTLNGLKQTRTFKELSTSKVYGMTAETTKTTGVDGLYFARRTDGSYLDGYTFAPSSDVSSFEDPSIVGKSFISYSFGTKVMFPNGDGAYSSANEYALDYLVVTATTRTQIAPVEILLNVRDRMGAGASGNSSGISKIKVVININNSTPHVQHPNNVYTLTTLPVVGNENQTLTGTGASTDFSIRPSTLVIYAATSTNEAGRGNDFLVDNEKDEVNFHIATPPRVIRFNAAGEEVDVDENGVLLLGNYLNVTITADTITITALNSSQSIEKMYVVFDVTDGKSSDGRELDHSTCRIQVQVMNAVMTVNNDGDGFDREEDGANLWTVESATQSDYTRARYFASGEIASNILKETVSDGQVKTIVKDTDGLQGAVLAPAMPNSTDLSNKYFTADETGESYIANVPFILTGNEHFERGGAVNLYIGKYANNSGNIDAFLTSAEIYYYIVNGTNADGTYNYTRYSASELKSLTAAQWLADDFYAKFYDGEGRWKVTDWAIEVVPKTSSTADNFISLGIMLRDDVAYGGDTAGKTTGWSSSMIVNNNNAYSVTSAATVDGFARYTYKLYINGLGIVPYTYYDQYDGYYTVSDPRKNTTNAYIAPYDSGNNKVGSDFGEQFVFGTDYDKKYADSTQKVFRYSDTIRVSSNKAQDPKNYTYIPMSYLALRNGLATVKNDGTGEFDFTSSKTFVAYDIGDEYGYNLSGLTGAVTYKDAITISDGTPEGTWTGSKLDDNPYLWITSFDYLNDTRPIQTIEEYRNVMLSPYFNQSLSMSAYTGEGNNHIDNYDDIKAEYKTGDLVYLAKQEYELPENLFGIGLLKKYTRASAASLTISIKVALCQESDQAGTNTKIAYTSDNRDVNTAVVTFKLEIGNDPVTLANSPNAETGVVYDENSGYYTELHLQVGSDAGVVNLVRNGTTVTDKKNVSNIIYNDDDVVSENGVVNEEKSDSAYFYYDSLTPIKNESVLSRLTAYTPVAGSNAFTFDNVAPAATNQRGWAQISMQNYFGSYDLTTGGFYPVTAEQLSKIDIDADFQPNPGIYGGNISGGATEGYSSFFRTAISPDGKTLTLTPNAKTTLNTELMKLKGAEITKYYAERGLKLDSKGKGYYPLKVVVYDSHGDGVAVGAYLAVEIRVYVDSAKPALSNNLEDYSANQTDNAKKIDVSLPVDTTYQFSLADIITSNSLLSYRDDVNSKNGSDWYWASDYDSLVKRANTSGNRSDMLRADTGMYLLSPFADEAWHSSTTTADLIAGNGMLSDNKIAKANQPDVIMYMNYTGGKNGSLDETSDPTGNSVQIRVNRRTTYNGKSYSNFVYKMKFTDNSDTSTDYLYINVTVTNLTPSVRTSQSMSVAQDLKMRVGDSFTVLTTPYDRFTGAETGKSVSDSAAASTSYQTVADSAKRSGIGSRNLCKISTDFGYATSVKFTDLTANNIDVNPTYKLHDYYDNDVKSQHLGYLAVADDDSPWSLRIEQVIVYNNSKSIRWQSMDLLSVEGTYSGTTYPLDILITADSVCNKLPVTFVLSDGEGGRVSYTMYITVESSRPSAIGAPGDDHTLCSALETTAKLGVYETYMMSDTATDYVHNKVEILNGTNRAEKTAYGHFTVNINEIAYDPDSNDNNNIALFTGNNGILTPDFDMFTINGLSLRKDGLCYYNDYYRIDVDKTYTNFTLTCLTYNPYRDFDELKFYVRDCGNNVFDRALPITIKICSLYSTVTNNRQAAAGKVTPTGVIDEATVDTINVKPYDDYMGDSVKVKQIIADEIANGVPENLRTKIVGVDSTYQFLHYNDVPASVDQNAADINTWGLFDSDVANTAINLDYDVRIYALMNEDAADYRNFSAMSIADASKLFAYDLTNHYWWINDASAETVNKQYFVGGVYAGGGNITNNVNSTLVEFINKYFVFEVGADGVSLSMRPVTRNIDSKILFYVEIEKNVPSSTDRFIRPTTTAVKSGTLFYVNVQDSAPIVNANASMLEFSGKIGESRIFPIFDNSNPFASMFTDSDAEDTVRVDGFVASGNTTKDYEDALVDADCDWRASAGKQRAIEITINNDDIEANGIPAHSLRVTILRRIDKLDSEGNYLNKVKFPVYIVGKDRANESDTATLMITIENSDFDIDETKLTEDARHFDSFGVGYEMSRGEKDRNYNIDVKIAPDDGAYAINLVADRWLSDPDFTSMAADTDSFRLIAPASATDAAKYLMNEPLNVFADENTTPSAVLTPMFGNNGNNVDEYHFVGFTVTALSYNRGEKSTAYIRVIDRSGNATADNAGIVFTVNIEVLNAAPTVISGHEVITYKVDGSDTKAGTPIAIDVTNHIEDKNTGDMENIRIVSMLPLLVDDTKINCTSVRDDSETGGNLVDVNLVDSTNMTVTPRKGFYGTQDVQVVVADGDLSQDVSARTATFIVRVIVVYDFTQVLKLNDISAIRSIPVKVTSEKLFPEVKDTYNNIVPVTPDPAPAVLASADGEETFNPGKDYVITSIIHNAVGINVDIRKDADGDWQFTCDREIEGLSFNVTFVRRIDLEDNVENPTTFNHTFVANVGVNHAPTLLENFKRSTGYLFKMGDSDYGLDSNGTVAIPTDMLFSDVDIELGDRLLFDPQATKTVSSTMCTVRISEDGTILYLTFNYNGETDLIVGIKDRTGETSTATIRIKNVDRPDAPFMSSIMISVETHPYIWLGVGIGILLLIILLILLIILLKRRKRKRDELEAMLVQELELEEEMLRIANTSNAMYQSFGFLPPTMSTQADPNLMIGGGGNAPANDAIGLNPGNNGVPTDSDM